MKPKRPRLSAPYSWKVLVEKLQDIDVVIEILCRFQKPRAYSVAVR